MVEFHVGKNLVDPTFGKGRLAPVFGFGIDFGIGVEGGYGVFLTYAHLEHFSQAFRAHKDLLQTFSFLEGEESLGIFFFSVFALEVGYM